MMRGLLNVWELDTLNATELQCARRPLAGVSDALNATEPQGTRRPLANPTCNQLKLLAPKGFPIAAPSLLLLLRQVSCWAHKAFGASGRANS